MLKIEYEELLRVRCQEVDELTDRVFERLGGNCVLDDKFSASFIQRGDTHPQIQIADAAEHLLSQRLA
ncbi:MAG: hypothetical protein CMJ83_05905, partial [Planctomycetes bacterium]|nr:hypothetical protein [Planctomycetota bacterium]